jgi:hypothetical protein
MNAHPRTDPIGMKNTRLPIHSRQETSERSTNKKASIQEQPHTQSTQSEKKTGPITKSGKSRSTSRTQKATDTVLALAEDIKFHSGIPYVDNRPGGGALWVSHHLEAGKIAETLKAANFRYHSVRGWWVK